jgi:hypothetical protein
VSSVGLITDLTFDDVRKFSNRETAVTTDDVIGVHQLLAQDGDGSFDFIDAVLEYM